MRVLHLLLLALLSASARGVIIYRGAGKPFDPNNTVTISLPNELAIDSPNRVLIFSQKPIEKVTINMTSYNLQSDDIGLRVFEKPGVNRSRGEDGYVYDLQYHVPIEFKPGEYLELNITYFYCPGVEKCEGSEELAEKSIRRSIRMVSHYVYILGETDKPLYRPGETVRFRFVALTRRNILPSSESLTWPTHKAVGEYWSAKKVEEIEPAMRRRRLAAPYFDSIEVKDPLNNVVQKWSDVRNFQALNLSHVLIGDAAEGKWSIVARVQEEVEEVAFQVRHYILPRFQAQVMVPEAIKPEDVNVTFNVCATYTNGPAMSGVYDAQICICSQRELSRQQDAKKLMPKNECRSNYESQTRKCMRFSGALDPTSCTNITANITKLVGGKPPGWSDKLGVFVEVSEEATGLSIVVSNTVEFKMWPEPKLELKMHSSFRPGFPVVGKVVYKNNGNSSEDLELIVREDTNPCGGWMSRGSTSPTRIMRYIPVTSGEEEYKFVLPPFDFENAASIVVRQVKSRNGSSEKETSGDMPDYFFPYWLPRPRPRWDLKAYKRLELWDGSTGLAIQVRVEERGNLSCPGKVKLQVFANEPLADNSTLMLHFLQRGQLTTRALALRSDHTCTSMDNEYGHYECRDDGEIVCKAGWRGLNCLTPVCPADCGVGGICVGPNRCACKPGWRGESCEICVPRNGCVNGDCVEGGDCVCRKGFTGYLCERALINFELVEKPEEVKTTTQSPETVTENASGSMDQKTSPRRSVFKHVATLELDSELGPELRAVVFVRVGERIATDFLQLENLQNCSSPAIAASSRNGGGLEFSKRVVAPGEQVNMILNITHGEGSDDNFTNTCLLSTIDVATKNFNTAGNEKIDFAALIDVLKGNRVQNDPMWISSSESAYRAAGIDFTHISSSPEKIRPDIICPMYGARRISMAGHPAPPMAMTDGMEKKIEAVPKPRLRDFFPEIWLFEAITLKNGSFEKALTVPDSLTSWEANAVCFLGDRGMWAPMRKPSLTVRMPFFVEFAPPVVVRRGEIIHLPITIFLHPNDNPGNRTCYEVEVSVEADPRDWRIVGASVFSTCICASESGELTKETFRLPMRPLRIGQLNLTALAVGRRGTGVCEEDADGDEEPEVVDVSEVTVLTRKEREIVTVTDAVRRSIRVEPEGVQKRVTVGGTFCLSDDDSEDYELKVELPDTEIVEGSLRSYVAVGGSVIGRALSNLDSLVQMPTGCGEQNLVKVAPSVYVVKYLLGRQNASELRKDALGRKAAGYIISGFDNELKYQHPNNGAFSTFGPKYGASGSTWLTAYVFEVFSEAESLPLSTILDQTLNAHPVLMQAFDFLVSQQEEDGCFKESGNRFLPHMAEKSASAESKLQLTSHVLAALSAAGSPLKEAKGSNYTESVKSAMKCLESTAKSFPPEEWSSLLIAKVLHATKKLKSLHGGSLLELLRKELKDRAKSDSTVSGSLKWWEDSEKEKMRSMYYARVRELETTAYALLALSPEAISREEQISVMKWISQQQNEKGGFYSTRDTVITLRALIENAGHFPTLMEPVRVKISSEEKLPVDIRLEVSPENDLVSNTFELGYHNVSDLRELKVEIESTKPACISAHVTSIYNVAEGRRADDVFEMEVSVDQGGSKANVMCTTARTTVCLRPRSGKGSGMLLVTMQLPSGWSVTMSELSKIPLNGDLEKMEFIAEQQEVSVYLKGFEVGVLEAERCFSVPLHQRMYVEESQPGLLMARDYYNPEEKMEVKLEVDSCKMYWESHMGGVVNETSGWTNTTLPPDVTETPKEEEKEEPTCPTCDEVETSLMAENLNKSLCHHERQFFVFKKHNATGDGSVKGLMYSFNFGNRLASWNTTLNVSETCECNLLKEANIVGIFGRRIYAGDLGVDLAGCEVVSFETIVKASVEFKEALETKMEEMEEGSGKYWCYGRKSFFALLKKLVPAKAN